MTKGHVDLLTKFRIIPVCVVELEITEGDMLKRNGIDRLSPTRSERFLGVSLSIGNQMLSSTKSASQLY